MNPCTWFESAAVATGQLHPILALYQETLAGSEVVLDSSTAKGGRSNDATSRREVPMERIQGKLRHYLVNEWLGARVTSRSWRFMFVTGDGVLHELLRRNCSS